MVVIQGPQQRGNELAADPRETTTSRRMATRTQTARHTRMVTRQSQRDAENEADSGVADEGDSASETEHAPRSGR
jgi:hypothetical protein